VVDNKSGFTAGLRALPLFWLCTIFLAGIILASQIAVSLWIWLLFALVAAGSVFLLRNRSTWLLQFSFVGLCLLLLGSARFQASQQVIEPDDLAYFNDMGTVTGVRGILEKPVLQKDGYVELLVRAQEIVLPNGASHQVAGLLLARTENGVNLNYGDRLLLSGELTAPAVYEDFSYRDYLARKNIYSLIPFAAVEKLESDKGNPIWAMLYALRQRGVETLYRIYPGREASLLAGILLGDESGISQSVQTAFNNTGTRHIIAISGFNISIIAGLFLALFGRLLGVRRGAWVAGIGIGIYTLLVGADAAVVRAAIMGILALVALQTGRQSFALNALAFSAALMALVNPLVLWDVGFQLSFAATLGLVLYAEPLRKRVDQWLDAHIRSDWAKRLSRPINDYLLLTVAATITTLPILLFYFHRLSIFSLPANILILPVQPALMILGGISMLAGMVLLPLGQLVGFLGWLPVAYTIRIVEILAALPGAAQSLSSFPLSMVFIYFAILAAISIPTIRQWIKSIHVQPLIPLAVLATFTMWIWNTALATPDGKLHLTLLDVPGEALLIETPNGRNLLINTGESANDLLENLSRQIPFGQSLDWLILAGRRDDQIGGINSGLDRLSPAAMGYAISDLEMEDQLKDEKLELSQFLPGDRLDLGSGAELEVVSVGVRGAVLELSWQNFQALLPLGLDFDQMEELDYGEDIGQVDLLLLADGGYSPLNPPEWIANLSPSAVLVATDSLNGALPSVDLGNIPAFSTGKNGWIQVITDSENMWLEVEQP
jgi:competence protein ComEC